ncbi:hypothetical protein [Streptomyces sp. NPDC056948]
MLEEGAVGHERLVDAGHQLRQNYDDVSAAYPACAPAATAVGAPGPPVE